jgi:cellobiose-specific phosphotransferase system component IIC
MRNDLTPALTFHTGWQKPANLDAAIAAIQEDDAPIIMWHPHSDASVFFAGAGAMAAVILLLWLLEKLGQALRFIGEKLIDLGSRP